MRRFRPARFRVFLSLGICLISGIQATAGGPNLQRPEKPWPGAVLATEDVILAKVRAPGPNPAAATKAVEQVLRANGLRKEREIRSVPGLMILRTIPNRQAADKGRNGLKRRIEALQATGRFEYVEPDYRVRILQLPTDTAFADGDLWGLRNTGQNGGIAGIDVNAVGAWAIETGSPSVTVAVIDTGIRYTHQDLAGNMWVNPGEIPGNGIDDDDNGFIDDIHGINALNGTGVPLDDHDHGTHVAGTIAATAFDAGRHVGVAYGVTLMALKFLDSTGNGSVAGAIACIDYAITNGADILNNSWGGTGYSQALADAVNSANAAGVLFVAAAGNAGTDNDASPTYPAGLDFPNVISVAAIDRTGALASFSNFGATSVDLAAPGVNILSTTSGSNSSYGTFNGTSMATPHVAGVAALIASANPAATLFELTARLLQSTTPLVSLNGRCLTGGMVNAEAALIISEDGDMELRASTPKGALIADEINPIFVQVTDLVPVIGAAVSGTLGEGSPTAFMDDGVAPDAVASDGTYTAEFLVAGGTPTIDLNIAATATGKNPAAITATFSIITPPPNDDFADRFLFLNTESTASGTTVQSTVEPGEPIAPAGAGSHTAWWEWVPDVSGFVTVSTEGSSFDTTLAIYQGTALGSLTPIGANDDAVGLQSAVGFTATAGQSYKIQVNGYGSETGTVQLNYGEFLVGPINNDFANRIVLESGTSATFGTNVGATMEDNEPYLYPWPPYESVWWEWIAPSSSEATITTYGSNFDTVLVIYTGDALTELTAVAVSDDAGGGFQSAATFTPEAGQSYKIQVYGNLFDPTGSITLNYPPPGSPGVDNDDFADAIVLEFGTTQTSGTNSGATTESGEPLNPGTSGNASVWWSWTASISGSAVIDTYGSDFDTTLAVYSGDSLESLLLVAANDDTGGSQSEVTFTAIQGKSYRIQVNGSGADTGNIKLNYPEPAPPPPLNDNLQDRILLPYGTSQATGRNTGATLEVGEPVNPAGAGSQSAWWEWIAPSNDPATIDTVGSDFDTTLAVYEGTGFDDLSLVAANNDTSGTASEVTINPESGRRYLIQVNGFGTAVGTVVLNYPLPGFPRPSNDNFTNRILLAPGTIRIEGSTDAATFESGEPANPLTAGGQTVWYEWIAPASGQVTIDTVDSLFDTTLAVYTGTDLGSLILVGANDNFINFYSTVAFDATAGESYKIQVDGSGATTGFLYLNYPMPFPVAVDPGRIRAAGSPGTFTSSEVSLVNGDSIPVSFSLSSPAAWITPLPDSGILSAGGQLDITLNMGPLPAFADSLYSSVMLEFDHPDLAAVEIPIEIIDNSLVVHIPDPNLRTTLEQHLSRLPGEPITGIELAIITTLTASSRGIVDLTGLENAVNLNFAYLDNNQIHDITPLSGLIGLLDLDLYNNNLTDISILPSLPILLYIDVRLNYLDLANGSADKTVIDSLIGSTEQILFDPQKAGLLSLSGWVGLHGIPPSNDGPLDVNGPLGIPNILAFSMGLDPFFASAGELPVARRVVGTNNYTFTYYRDLKAIGITTDILTSPILSGWSATVPTRINILWDDGNGRQLVEAMFEHASDRLFFVLEVTSD